MIGYEQCKNTLPSPQTEHKYSNYKIFVLKVHYFPYNFKNHLNILYV